MVNGDNSDTYFAAHEDPSVTASICLEKGKTFFNNLESNDYLTRIKNMWRFYHGDFGSGVNKHEISFGGEDGEFTNLMINHFRNIANHILNMVTSNRPALEARAINNDYKSQAQTYLANSILEYYMREKELEKSLKDACEMSIVLGSSFLKMEWNATAGQQQDFDEEDGKFIYEGELEFSVLSPFDVVFDGTKDRWTKEWVIVRSKQNRFNLIAKYPELGDKIKNIPKKTDTFNIKMWSNDSTDDIYVYEFYHERCEALPDGRYILFLDEDIVLLDAALPYREVPIFRIAPSNIIGTPYGYSPMFDLYPIQQVVNSTSSTIATNQNTFGVQNIYVQRGADLNVTSLEGAMNVIEGNSKPEALQLTATPKEVFDSLQMYIQQMETLSGVNSVARGNPEASLRSGTSLALVQSMALQFMSGLQQSYVRLMEDVGTTLIQILKDYANSPKVVALVGKNNRTKLKEFTGESISSINRVIVDVGNPLARCLAKDTPVLMYDGSIKMVQDIELGEQVMGPDSYPRTVSNVNSDIEMMYEVTSKDSNRNIKYGCNESHILTLKYCSDDERYDVKKGDIVDISVAEYLKLPNRHQRLLQGFTVGVEYDKKDLPIPPYILGSWLGDGNSRSTSITTMDIEMVNEWQTYADQIGMNVRVSENRQPNKSKNYFITSREQHGRSDRNPFMNSLRELELITNKHIPTIYLRTSRADRLELLAGLIDTDGYRIDETFIFTQKNERLSNEVVHLAKSLGFRVTSKKVKSNSSELVGELDSEVFKITIGGDTWEIPTRLPRKKAQKKEKSRDPLNYGINITPVGEDRYYGFTLAEEPHFLLGDFTVTHNTIAGRVNMAEQMLQMKLLKTPQEYMQVITTGRLEPLMQGEVDEMLLIQLENEELIDGENPLVAPTDSHSIHINEHKAVLADPDFRRDPELVRRVMDHMSMHLDALKNTDPELLQIIGEQPSPLNPGLQALQGPPPGAPQQMPPAGSMEGAVPGSMEVPQDAMMSEGEQFTDPSGQNMRMPGPANVDPNMLVNPDIQAQAMGNLKE